VPLFYQQIVLLTYLTDNLPRIQLVSATGGLIPENS